MRYCVHCGKEVNDNAVICLSCGCFVDTQNSRSNVGSDNLLLTLSNRIKTNGTIWFAVAVVQIIVGILCNFLILIVGILNIINAVRDLKYSNTILTQPTEIIQNFEKIGPPLIVLIYNLLFGGIVGIAGSLYYFFAIRSFVMDNQSYFAAAADSVHKSARPENK